MTRLTTRVPVYELRVGDLVSTPTGVDGVVAAIRDSPGHRDYVVLTIGGLHCILHRTELVQVTLEDEGR